MRYFQILLTLCSILYSRATVDLTLPEMQHLANHLSRDECLKLVAALHFNSFKLELYKSLEDAENALPEDISCLKLLLEWNSNEGKGKTHEKISLRLRQLGRQDLASWLDSAVFKELRDEIEKVANDLTESPEEKNISPVQVFEDPDDYEKKFIKNDEIWDFVPKMVVVIFITGCVLTLVYIANQLVTRYRINRWERIDKELKLYQQQQELEEMYQQQESDEMYQQQQESEASWRSYKQTYLSSD